MNRPPADRATRAAAMVFDGEPRTLRARDIERREPCRGERWVEVLATTLCGSDLHTWNGRRTVATPTILGHEIVGRIVEEGPGCPGVDARGRPLRVGTRVTWAIVASCGSCDRCVGGLPQKCRSAVKYGHERAEGRFALTGGLATHCILAAGTTILALEDGIPLPAAVPAGCAGATVAAAIDACAIRENDVVGVFGCGLLGLTACAMASDLGARVVAIEPDENRRSLARRFGAAEAVGYELLAETVPRGFDSIVEVSGRNSAFTAGIESLRVGGTLVLVGSVAPAPDVPLSLEAVVRKCLTIRGIHNYKPADLVRAVEFLERRHAAFPFAECVSAWYPLGAAADAFRAASSSAHVRVGIVPGPRPADLSRGAEAEFSRRVPGPPRRPPRA